MLAQPPASRHKCITMSSGSQEKKGLQVDPSHGIISAMNDNEKLNEYRCTRNSIYKKGSLGYLDMSVREGYYILAYSRDGALRQMMLRYPNEVDFTCDLWREGV